MPAGPAETTRPATARRATPADALAIDALEAAALAEQRTLRGGELYATTAPSHRDADATWVGELAGAVVGFLAARVDERRVGVVDVIYVDPDCRGVGVGEAIMEAALEWFTAQACVGVDAVALPGARATKNFFEESGFTARLLVMHRRL